MPNIGIVLAGGFAKGAYQVGILKAIKEFFSYDQIACVSASSIGALNTYAYLLDKVDVAEKMWRSLDFKGTRSFASRYMHSSYIANTIDELVGESGIPKSCMYIACFNFTKVKLNYINLRDVYKDDIRSYLRASVTMPMISRAVNISGMKYVDGGLVDNIPVRPIMKHPIDYAIVIHFDNDNYIFENPYFDSRLIKINFMDQKIIKNSLAFDKDSISYMLRTGYDESMSLLNIIFGNGIDDLEYIYNRINFINSLRGDKKYRLTGDVVVGNINKVLKKFISYSI